MSSDSRTRHEGDLPDGRLDLDPVFHPGSVCLVGISANARKLNGLPLDRLRRHGFAGGIQLVNPKYGEIEGIPCFPSVDAAAEPFDLALVMVPAAQVPETVRACARRGARAAVVLSSGFEETAGGGPFAAELQRAAEENRIAVVGPNCEGVWSVRARTVLTFGSAAARDALTHAPIAIVSQSGALAGGLARHLQDAGTGCAYVVSVGNETVLGVCDYLEYLIEQDDVQVVLLFIESLRDGQRLPALARRAREKGVTLVALKAGNSYKASEATASHTGKIATAHALYSDILRGAGVILVDSLSELIEAAQVLTSLPRPRAGSVPAGGIAIFSIPGGTRAMTIDACEAAGLPLATFDDGTVAALTERLPAFGYPRNPTDMTGEVLNRPEMFGDCLELVCADPATEAVVLQLANRGPRDLRDHRATIVEAARRHRLPVVVSFLGDVLPATDRQAFADEGVVLARDPSDAVRYLSYAYRARAAGDGDSFSETQAPGRLPPPGASWAEWMEALGETGFVVPRHAIAGPGERPPELRFPVALKALPADAAHKTERGLIALSLTNWQDVEDQARRMRSALGRLDACLLLQEMAPAGVEVVVTAHTDADFGPVLTVGAGGVLIELIGDASHLTLPTTSHLVRQAIQRIKLGRLLAGFRGNRPCDVDALARSAAALGNAFAVMAEELRPRSIELNPVIVSERGAAAVDLLVEGSAIAVLTHPAASTQAGTPLAP